MASSTTSLPTALLGDDEILPPVSPVAGNATAAVRVLRKELVERPSTEQLEAYSLNRDEMLTQSRKNGSMYFIPRAEGVPCGLINQGATCYLNSLLQSMFQTIEFRAAVYTWKYDENKHGNEEKCIPLQLQTLFASLELSKQSAVSTKDLTKAFGWTSAEAFTQHDIQELTCILFEALEQSDPVHFKEATKLWRGKSCDFIQPKDMTDPTQRHERTEEFMDIQIPIKGFDTLEKALGQVVAIECMEGDNQWYCDELDNKVDAIKGTTFKEIPSILSLHLMRFQFDSVTFRRVKVLDTLIFPPALNLNVLVGGGGTESELLEYDLTTILMHSGSADRGHYYAFIKTCDQWACYNDANVHLLDQSEVDAIFKLKEESEQEDKDLHVPHNSTSNAYMLVYRQRVIAPAPQVTAAVVPEKLRQTIEEHNTSWEVLSECYRIHQQMVELVIYPPSAVLASSEDVKVPRVSLFLHQSCTYQETLTVARKVCFDNEDWSTQVDKPPQFSRLRKFNLHLRRAGETFGTKKDSTLLTLGFSLHATLIMEFSDVDEWVEFNPNEMSLKLITWNSETHEPGPIIEIVVPGENEATVEGTRLCAAKALAGDCHDAEALIKLLRIVRVESNQANLLDDDTLLLRKHLNIWPGESLYIEVVKEDDLVCDIMSTFSSAQDSISILVNHPDEPYDLISVPMKRCDTLKLLKDTAIKMLPIELEASEVHLKRGTSKGIMLKDESKSLHSLSFVDGSVVWLARGRPCRPNEFLIEFVKYAPTEKPNFSPLLTIPIAESAKIKDVKEMLSKALLPLEINPSCLRLRDKKLTTAGSILRDSVTVRRSLMNLLDGRQVAVQFLEDPETITTDDIIISIRHFRTSSMKFSPMVEMVVSKSFTQQELRKAIETKFGEKLIQVPIDTPMPVVDIIKDTEDIEIKDMDKDDKLPEAIREKDFFQLAKGLSNGPPLKASSAATQLKWEDPKWTSVSDASIGRPPLSLRDGSLLYIRSNIDAINTTVIVPVKTSTSKKTTSNTSYVSSRSTTRREPKLNISVASNDKVSNGNTPAHRLAGLLGVTLESAQFALEAAGQDEVLAKEFLRTS